MLSQIQIRQLKPSSIHPFEWGALTWYANRELGNCDEMTVGRCVLKPGQSNPRHYHPNCTEILIVFKGRIAHTDQRGEETELNEGDTVTIPPHIRHRARNIGDEDAILYIAFSSADRQTVEE